MTLATLTSQYFATADDLGNAIPTFTGNVEAELIVDGKDYFDRIFKALDPSLVPPPPAVDEVFMVGWTFDASFIHPPSTKGIGQLLVEAQARGAKVWVVLNGIQGGNRTPALPFSACLSASIFMRFLEFPAASGTYPLIDRVLMEFSGPRAGSQHQKVCYIKSGSDHVAFVGGIDFDKTRDDTNEHDGVRIPNWGWHDAAIQLRGDPVTSVVSNLSSRWTETAALPTRHYWSIPFLPSMPLALNPSPAATGPSLPTGPLALTPNSDIAVQVLRSRYPLKLPHESPPVNWIGPPTGGIRQVYATLKKAIFAATRYIYIEDQFLADTRYLSGYAEGYSLLPALLAVLTDPNKDIKLIGLTSGKADGFALLNAATPTDTLQSAVIDRLPTAKKANVSVWKLTDRMVHSKLWLIDDIFCSVGSANLHSRSMYGTDQELQVAVVDAKVDAQGKPAGKVRDWRSKLWAEHMDVLPSHAILKSDLDNLDLALGMWRKSWQVGGTPNTWRVSGEPAGFNPTRLRRTFVGPDPIEY